jgi:hypothetical protein
VKQSVRFLRLNTDLCVLVETSFVINVVIEGFGHFRNPSFRGTLTQPTAMQMGSLNSECERPTILFECSWEYQGRLNMAKVGRDYRYGGNGSFYVD